SAQTFTDDPIVAGVTPIRAVHITELRQTIDQFRAYAGLSPSAWTDPTITAGVTIVRAVHVLELRARFDEALNRLAWGASAYTDPTLTGSFVRATHVSELRTRVRAALTRAASTQPPVGPPPCGFTFTPGSVTWPADGGIGHFIIAATQQTCEWTAVSNADWLLPGTTFYSGSGDESYGVGRNDTGV